MKKFKLSIPLFITLGITLILFIIGSICDRPISEAVGNQGNWLGIMLTCLGNQPTILLGSFASAVLLFAPKRNKKSLDIFMRVGAIAIFLIMTYFLFDSSKEYVEFEKTQAYEKILTIALLAEIVVVDAVIFLLTWKHREKLSDNNAIRVAVMMIAIVVLYATSTEAIKYIVSRPRPRVVLYGIEEFRPWYVMKPLYCMSHDDCKSFVSGHVSNAACMLTLIPLFTSLTKLNTKKYCWEVSVIVGAVLTFIVAYSRMLAEAHYLSDVTGGIITSSICQIIVLLVGPRIAKDK